MNSSKSTFWPRYPVGDKESVYVIGVIALTYGRLDTAFRLIFSATTEIPPEKCEVLFARVQNDSRAKMLDEIRSRRDLYPEVQQRITHFLKGFQICSDKRHTLMHSISLMTKDLTLSRFSRNAKVLIYQPSLADLRQIADEIQTYSNFGFGLAGVIPAPFELPHVTARRARGEKPWPLPDEPPLPRVLQPLPPVAD